MHAHACMQDISAGAVIGRAEAILRADRNPAVATVSAGN
jgi:hypothetical protein